jgi:dTDP-glucose 4,6-dehydratase
MKHIVITGGCGFIGHHVIDLIQQTTDWRVSVLDALTYASRGLERLAEIDALNSGRVRIFPVNISQPIHNDIKKELGDVDYIVHMAAEVHVDQSISDPEKFIYSNIMGTFRMLQLARELNVRKFLYFSTDEVFGPALDEKPHKEWDRYNSSNPYAATKAAGEELTLAWANTYSVPTVITHCTNVFGERQNPEAFIPATIRKILNQETVRIHTNAKKESGSRFYIHAQDVAKAIWFLLEANVALRDKFNITGLDEISNLNLAKKIAHMLDKPLDCILVDADRPGCDFRYGLDGSKLRGLGWNPSRDYFTFLRKTVLWYQEHPEWLTKRSSAVFGGHR